MSVLMAILAAGSVANADIRPILREQGFEGPLNGREEITFAGTIKQGRNEYRIYTYHGVFRAANVDHGVNRLIVMLNGRDFLGQYSISMPSKCSVNGQKVICDSDNPCVITFTNRGPPAEIWFAGEVLDFELGDKF